jgi:hypothetical protein
VFETADEYSDYYRDYHAFWKLYGLDLPDEVLRKLYYENVLRIIPGSGGRRGSDTYLRSTMGVSNGDATSGDRRNRATAGHRRYDRLDRTWLGSSHSVGQRHV